MKKIYYLLVIGFTFLSVNMNAQESLINFEEQLILVNGESINVASTTLKGEEKEIIKQWNSYVKKYIDSKMKEDKGVLVVNKIVLEQVTNKRGDLLTYIYKKDNVVSLNVSYKLGYDIYINSKEYENEFIGLNRFVNRFVYNYYNDYLPELIKIEKVSLKKLEKENKKAKKAIKKANKNIISKSKKITKSKKRLTSLEAELVSETEKDAKQKLTIKKEELSSKVISYNSAIKMSFKTIESNEMIVKTLNPKIEEVTNDIDKIKLSLNEVTMLLKSIK